MIKTIGVVTLSLFMAFLLCGTSLAIGPSAATNRTYMTNGADERLIDAKFDIMRARIDGMDEALKVKAEEMERRLEGLNELRNDVVKDREQFVRKDIYDTKIKTLDELTNRVTIIETRLFVWMSAMAVFFVVLQVIAHFWMDSKKSSRSASKFSEEDLVRIRDAWMKVK